MKFHLLTIFPQFFEGPFQYGVVARAAEAGALELNVHDLRNWTHDLHRTVDDRPFGGGAGMLLKPEPIFDAVETIWPSRGERRKVILLSAQGRKFNQQIARGLLENDELMLICGRYEGVDERVAEHLADDDLTGRELEVLRLIRDGYRNKQIADQLVIAETTVNFHIKNLVDKLGANDRAHAVAIAVRRGLLQV